MKIEEEFLSSLPENLEVLVESPVGSGSFHCGPHYWIRGQRDGSVVLSRAVIRHVVDKLRRERITE